MGWPNVRQFMISVTLSIVLCTLGAGIAQAQQSVDLAIIVSAKSSVSDLTMRDLRRIFTGERRELDGKNDVLLMVPPPGTPERDVMLNAIYNMSEAEFKKFWLGKKFRGEAVSEPLVVSSKQLLNDGVAVMPGAVACIKVQDIRLAEVKVLRVNGLLPGQNGYPVH